MYIISIIPNIVFIILKYFSLCKVGYYKAHPEVPKELSERAILFIKLCFEPDPVKRATAAQLLEDSFLGKITIL